jgi:predicted permease
MDIYLKLFEVLFPVFFVVGIGYYLGKKNPNFDNSFITTFASNVGTPAMVIYSITSTGITFEQYTSYFVYYLIAIIGFAFTGLLILYLLKTKDIIREIPVFILPNNGNMGIPICLFAYGSQGLGIAASISSLIILLHFTLGVFLADRKFDFNVLIKNPPFYAIIFSVSFIYLDLEMPKAIINLTELLTYTAIVLILMSLGIALTKLKVFSLTNSIISSIGRVIIGPLIGFLVIIFFDLSGFGAGVILIQSAMPSAILNYLIGSMYSPKEIVDNIASTIVVSTIMSFITVPIMVFIALKYFY